MLALVRTAVMACFLVFATSSGWGQTTAGTPAITFAPNRAGGVTVSWVAMSKAIGYRVTRFKEDDSCCNSTVNVPATTLSIIDGISTPGVYQYTVTAVYRSTVTTMNRSLTGPSVQGTYELMVLDPVAFRPLSINRSIMTPCTPPQQIGGPSPASVRANPGGSREAATTAYVKWDSVSGAVAYKLERAPKGGSTWSDLGCFLSPQTSRTEHTRTDVPVEATIYPGGSYTYKVTAYQSNGAAGWNSASLTLPYMQNPSSLTFTRTGNQVRLCWVFTQRSNSAEPNRFVVTSSYGTRFTTSGGTGSRCADVYGVPDGTQIFQVGSQYYAYPAPSYLETPLATRPSITIVISP